VLDAFADLDTREAAAAAERVPVDRDWRLDGRRLLDAAGRLAPPPVPLAYGSGVERNLDLLERLAAGRELLGTSPETVGRAKDPFAFAALLRELGVPHPEVRREPPPVADDGAWLTKRVGGAGGAHVRLATEPPAPGRYYQWRAAGRPVSVLVAGDGSGHAVSLAFSEQWPDPTPERPFRYGGAAAPASLPDRLAGALGDVAARVAAASHLRGLGSVDALADGDAFHVLELNPRWGASFDAYELAYAVPLFGLHVEACRGRLPRPLPAPARAAASATLWAPERVVVPEGFRWPTWTADRGVAGTVVPAGGPICTIFGEALTAAEARRWRGPARWRCSRGCGDTGGRPPPLLAPPLPLAAGEGRGEAAAPLTPAGSRRSSAARARSGGRPASARGTAGWRPCTGRCPSARSALGETRSAPARVAGTQPRPARSCSFPTTGLATRTATNARGGW
jgi:predicted ATP-grasp superfamily ATP-dependent carboligase